MKKSHNLAKCLLASCMAFAMVAVLAGPISAEIHTIVPGDTLSGIAARYGVDMDELARLNRISNPNLIFVGEELEIPGTQSADSSTETSDTEAGETETSEQPPAEPDEPELPANPQETTTSDPPVPPSISIADSVGEDGAIYAVLAVAPTAPPADDNTDDSDDAEQSDDETQEIAWRPYTIRPGDWLSALAERFSTTVEEIVEVNEITNQNLIYVGQSILLPQVVDPAAETPVVLETKAEIEARMEHWAEYYSVPPELLKALTWWESGWNNKAISSVGAIGIGQLMPATVDFVRDVLIGVWLDPHVPDDNIRMSTRFLRYLLDETGWDRSLALASYYQGLYAVRKYGIYNISRPYVNGILALQARFE